MALDKTVADALAEPMPTADSDGVRGAIAKELEGYAVATPPPEAPTETSAFSPDPLLRGATYTGLAAAAVPAGLTGVRAYNAIRENYQPDKKSTMDLRKTLADQGLNFRVGDLENGPSILGETTQAPPTSWADLENSSRQYIPFSGADSKLNTQAKAIEAATSSSPTAVADKTLAAIKAAVGRREAESDALYTKLGGMNTYGKIDPAPIVAGLKNFVGEVNGGTEKLAKIPTVEDAATLLVLAGKRDEAEAVLKANPNPATRPDIDAFLNAADDLHNGMDFDSHNRVRKTIGRSIGAFPTPLGGSAPPEQNALRAVYAKSMGTLDDFAAQHPDNQTFVDTLKQANALHKRDIDFYDESNLLRKTYNGGYDARGAQLFKDLINPNNRQQVATLAPYVLQGTPEEQAAFFGPQFAPRATQQLLGTGTKGGSEAIMSKAKALGATLGASALPGIVSGSPLAASISIPITAAAELGGWAGSNVMNRTPGALSRMWAAKPGWDTVKGILSRVRQ